jgi:hypothetical protein
VIQEARKEQARAMKKIMDMIMEGFIVFCVFVIFCALFGIVFYLPVHLVIRYEVEKLQKNFDNMDRELAEQRFILKSIKEQQEARKP